MENKFVYKNILLILFALTFAGCAMSTKYVPYTGQKFVEKDKYYSITIYPENQMPPATTPYWVIGRVEVEGYTNDGVNPDMLMDKAKAIARKKGADAIIKARTEMAQRQEVYETPGYFGYHRYHPGRAVVYADNILRFRVELITFSPVQR